MKAQSTLEYDCLNKIHNSSKTKTFPRFGNTTIIVSDTVHYDKSIITLTDVKPEFLGIFGTGLLFPKLILGASTNGDGEFKINTSPSQDTLSISSVRELKMTASNLNIKAFSFLLWQKGLANPKLYIVELSSKAINSGTEQFIKYSKVISFGFCSILI